MKFIYTIAALLTALSIIVLQLFRGIYIINFIQNGIWIFISLVISFRAIKYNKQFLTWLFIFSVFFLVSMLSIILNSDTFMQPYSYYKLAKFFLLWAFMFFVGYFLGEELLQALYKVSILWILTTFIYAAMVSFNTLQLHSMLHHLKSTYLPLGRSLSVAALSTLFLGLGKRKLMKFINYIIFLAAIVVLLAIDSKGPLFSTIFIGSTIILIIQIIKQATVKGLIYVTSTFVLLLLLVMGYYAADINVPYEKIILNNSSVRSRLQLYDYALDMFISKPIIGSGLGSYYTTLPNDALNSVNLQYTNTSYKYPHNIFFESIAETGILGTVWVILLLIYPLYITHRKICNYIAIYKIKNIQTIKNMVASIALYINSIVISLFSSDITGNYWIALFAGVLLFQAKNSGLLFESTEAANEGI